ncbi:DDE family transposase [Tepidimonas ignava]|uniref:DDE family transposase n=2 Tax=Tepidimonas ignava TaxID=114249 RepID=A0A4R3LGW7_9BURK|nr:DDE family transposase [Tepidimonas ignava]TSE20358.1 hypothetical protein Tigna_01989 [Tepidimonas ignava]
MSVCPATEDFFRLRLDHMIDLRHPLAVLAWRMPWQELEARVAHRFSRKARAGVAMPELDWFGEQVQTSERVSRAGRPRVPLRIMISLLYLKHAFNESDEGVVERWRDTPRWQYFSGLAYYEDRLPCDATTLVKFRQLLGEEGVQELLAQTINVAVELKLIKPQELTRVIVDSTVQPKAIAHPTDSRLLETARAQPRPAPSQLPCGKRSVGPCTRPRASWPRVASTKPWTDRASSMLGMPPEVECISKGKARRIRPQDRKRLKRRQAIEPIIGHLKMDHRMQRCHLKGQTGDRLHAVLCAAGYNIRWLLRMIAKKGITFLWAVLLCLLQASAPLRAGRAQLRWSTHAAAMVR